MRWRACQCHGCLAPPSMNLTVFDTIGVLRFPDDLVPGQESLTKSEARSAEGRRTVTSDRRNDSRRESEACRAETRVRAMRAKAGAGGGNRTRTSLSGPRILSRDIATSRNIQESTICENTQ